MSFAFKSFLLVVASVQEPENEQLSRQLYAEEQILSELIIQQKEEPEIHCESLSMSNKFNVLQTVSM